MLGDQDGKWIAPSREATVSPCQVCGKTCSHDLLFDLKGNVTSGQKVKCLECAGRLEERAAILEIDMPSRPAHYTDEMRRMFEIGWVAYAAAIHARGESLCRST